MSVYRHAALILPATGFVPRTANTQQTKLGVTEQLDFLSSFLHGPSQYISTAINLVCMPSVTSC